MHHKCFRPVVSASSTDSERICFLVPNKVHLWELVSHREFSYSYLSLFPVNYYSFVRIIATLVHINSFTTNLKVEPLARRAIYSSNSILSGGKKGSQHLPQSIARHSRLLLSTRPCVSHAAAFVVVVIVSSRIMGRFFPSGAATDEEAVWRWKRR